MRTAATCVNIQLGSQRLVNKVAVEALVQLSDVFQEFIVVMQQWYFVAFPVHNTLHVNMFGVRL